MCIEISGLLRSEISRVRAYKSAGPKGVGKRDAQMKQNGSNGDAQMMQKGARGMRQGCKQELKCECATCGLIGWRGTLSVHAGGIPKFCTRFCPTACPM
jgi:hypothetical protein